MIERIKAMLKVLYRKCTDGEYHRYSSKDLGSPCVKSENNKITVTSSRLAYGERFELRKKLMAELRNKYPKYTIKVKDINVGYYDKCLWRYLEEVCLREWEPRNSCWHKYAQNNKCVDKLDDGEIFDSDRRRLLLRRIKREHMSLEDNIFDKLAFDEDNFVYILSNNVYTEPYKIEKIFHTVMKKGWNEYASIFNPIIIGYSHNRGIHQVISGRHRVAVLKCLVNRGMISKNMKIHCHYVEYPFETLTYTRPYSDHCKQCRWNRKIVFDGNTHQDFSIVAGKIEILGKKTSAKWTLVENVADTMFRGKKVVDIGAHRGFYCMKAIEYGAVKATAFEPADWLTECLYKLKTHTAEEKLEIYKGDFYNPSDYRYLLENKYNTVLLLGVIHHLLRIGIQKNILHSFDELMGRIASIVNYGVVIEFSLPREESLRLPAIREYRDNFSLSNFEDALAKCFPYYKRLGRCRYRSGNKFGRFMYYAIKT